MNRYLGSGDYVGHAAKIERELPDALPDPKKELAFNSGSGGVIAFVPSELIYVGRLRRPRSALFLQSVSGSVSISTMAPHARFAFRGLVGSTCKLTLQALSKACIVVNEDSVSGFKVLYTVTRLMPAFRATAATPLALMTSANAVFSTAPSPSRIASLIYADAYAASLRSSVR